MMRNSCLSLLLVCRGQGEEAAEPSKPPFGESSPAQLPRLSDALVPDGELDEWESAASVPMARDGR